MKICFFTYIILELNAALDTGKYDDIPMSEVQEHIESGAIVAWLKHRVPSMDLSLLADEHIAEYQADLEDLLENYCGRERRKWGVGKRGLCLLIAWTNEMVQRRTSSWVPPENAGGWGGIPVSVISM